MTIPRPALLWNFAETPGILDPRISFARADVSRGASYMDRLGVLKTAPAGALRWTWHPTTLEPRGALIEPSRTNLILYSEQLDNAAHTKTNASISANSVAAPDGATTADTITISGASGSANQAITITAGNAITLSLYFKQLTSSHGRLRISDGTNSVAAWFNLAAGTVGTASTGATTCIYSAHSMENVGGGWYRCELTVTTATSTAFTCYSSCAASDNIEPANADSVYAWGMQAESPGTTSAASSYIATTSAAVTRAGDVLLIAANSAWFNAAEGTMMFEWTDRIGSGSRIVGGIGAAFANTAYVTRTASQVTFSVRSGDVSQATLTNSTALVPGAVIRAAVAWKANDFAMAVNGAMSTPDVSGAVPVSVSRLGVGNAPWDAAGGNQAALPFRRAAYWPLRLADASMQSLTA